MEAFVIVGGVIGVLALIVYMVTRKPDDPQSLDIEATVYCASCKHRIRSFGASVQDARIKAEDIHNNHGMCKRPTFALIGVRKARG